MDRVRVRGQAGQFADKVDVHDESFLSNVNDAARQSDACSSEHARFLKWILLIDHAQVHEGKINSARTMLNKWIRANARNGLA